MLILADLYDFDGTVFNGESGSEFMRFCYKRHPKLVRYIPHQLKAAFKRFVLHKGSFDGFKEELYCFLKGIDDVDAEAQLFWEKNIVKMNPWFKPREHDVPVVICSASPLFQIKPVCDMLGVDLVIATDMNPKTGKINTVNCKGENKLEYIQKYAPDYTFRDVYTDSIKNDMSILNLATREKYIVENGSIRIF